MLVHLLYLHLESISYLLLLDFKKIILLKLNHCLCYQEWGSPSCFYSCRRKYNRWKHPTGVLLKACQSRYKRKGSGGKKLSLVPLFTHYIVLSIHLLVVTVHVLKSDVIGLCEYLCFKIIELLNLHSWLGRCTKNLPIYKILGTAFIPKLWWMLLCCCLLFLTEFESNFEFAPISLTCERKETNKNCIQDNSNCFQSLPAQ